MSSERARGHLPLNCRFILHRDEIFDRIDTDDDGQLSQEEREAARAEVEDRVANGEINRRRIRPERRRARHHLLKRLKWAYDVDGDQQLDATERQALMSGLEARCEMRRDRFIAMFDADNDGQLNEEERQAAAEARRERRQNRRDFILDRYDANNDGRIGPVEREALRDDLRDRASAKRDEIKAHFDANNDGVLDQAEKDALKAAIRDRFENGRQEEASE